MRRLISLTLVIFLSLSFIATTGFSYANCGKICCCAFNMKGLHLTQKIQAQFKGNCCSKSSMHPCGLTTGQNFEFQICTLPIVRSDTNSSSNLVVMLDNPLYTNKILNYKRVWLSAKNFIHSSPIYLQNLSLQI